MNTGPLPPRREGPKKAPIWGRGEEGSEPGRSWALRSKHLCSLVQNTGQSTKEALKDLLTQIVFSCKAPTINQGQLDLILGFLCSLGSFMSRLRGTEKPAKNSPSLRPLPHGVHVSVHTPACAPRRADRGCGSQGSTRPSSPRGRRGVLAGVDLSLRLPGLWEQLQGPGRIPVRPAPAPALPPRLAPPRRAPARSHLSPPC